MKIMKILALALAVLLMVFALAEQSADELGIDLEIDGAELEGAEGIGIDGEAILMEGDGVLDLTLGDLVAEAPEVPATVAYRFIVNGEEYAAQVAVEGEEIVRPADPEAAEGWIFAGWALEDGAALFVDADGDGETDPVIARVDPQQPEVIVAARFVEKKEQPAEGADTDDDGGDNAATADDTQQQPADDADTDDTRSGGVNAATPDGDTTDDTKEDTTSPDTDDAVPPSPEGEGSDPAAEQPADEQQPAEASPVPNELTYTGEAQALVSAEGAWLYSLDGENYSADLPAAVNAGEYTVFYKAAEDAEAQSLTVTVAKADVVFTPPTAATGEE